MGRPGAAGMCEICGTPPTWTIVRQGDAVVTWACRFGEHLHAVMTNLQRDFEVTELHVTPTAKAREVAEVNRMVREILPELPGP